MGIVMPKLSILERLTIPRLLPKEGDITKLRVIRDLQHALSFPQEELRLLDFNRQPGGGVLWNTEGAAKIGLKDVTIGETLMADIVATLKQLNEAQKLDFDTLGLYERFVENPQVAPISSNGHKEKAVPAGKKRKQPAGCAPPAPIANGHSEAPVPEKAAV